ncbi:hypothetical protein WJX79_001596 [Trebouxia sp. C0005]
MSRRVPQRRGVGRGTVDPALASAAMVESKTKLAAGVKPLAGGGGIFKSAAVEVLRRERRLMTTGDITKVALEMELINCQGKTPDATMASALYTDVKRKLHLSVFTRPQEGMFGLREWEEDEGFIPPTQDANDPSYDPSGSVKKARQPSARAAPRPRRFKETTNSKWDDYYEAESPPSYPHLQRISSARQGSYSDKALLLLSGACEVGSPMKIQRGVGKKSSGRYQMQYEEEFFYEEEGEGEDESDTRQRWPARSADGKFRKASLNRRPSPVLLPNRRRIRTPSPSLPDSLSPHPSMHDGLAALHEAATSPERQARALSSALPSRVASTALPFYQDAPSGPQAYGSGEAPELIQQLPGQAPAGLQATSPEPAYKKTKLAHLRVKVPGGGAGAEVQRPVYQMHAYPPGVTPPSTNNTPWGVALGQTLATPRMPDPQTSPPAPRVMEPAAGHGSWVQGIPGCGDAHASNSPSPAGEACLTTPTDLLLQAAEEEEAAEQLLLQQQQALRSVGSKGGAFQPWRGGQGAAAEPHQQPAAASPGDEPGRSLGLDLRPKGLDTSNKQRTPRLGLRARALDLPLQASRTSSHDLDMAHSSPVFGAQPNPSAQYAGMISVSQLETRVRRLEQQLGSRHPQVGKAWLLLSRAYQAEAADGAPEHATSAHQALVRAWQICAGCVADDDKGALHSSMFKESFGYLFGRLKSLSQPPNADLGKIPDNMVPLELPKRLMQLSEAATSGS